MRYYKTLKQYKASNLVYDTEQELATSYDWYWLAKRINGQMVLNNYYYSPTTGRHAYKIRDLFDSLDIEYVTIEAPGGLQELEVSIDHYQDKIDDLKKCMAKPRTHAAKNEERKIEIEALTGKILTVKALQREGAA